MPPGPFELLGRDLAEEPFLQSSDRLRLHPRQHMRVDSQGECGITLAQALLHDLRMLAMRQQIGGVAVPEIAEPDPRQSGLLGDPAEVPADDVVQVQGLAVRLTEDQVLLFPPLILSEIT